MHKKCSEWDIQNKRLSDSLVEELHKWNNKIIVLQIIEIHKVLNIKKFIFKLLKSKINAIMNF